MAKKTDLLDTFHLSISDYITDTVHLSLPEHGAYLLILFAMRRAGGYLPNEDVKLANICKVTLLRWKKLAPSIRSLLIVEGDRLTQKRLRNDVVEDLKTSEKNRENGRLGGEAKSLKTKHPEVANATPSPAVRHKAVVATLPFEVPGTSKSSERSKRGSPLPAGWVPDQSLITYGIGLGFAPNQINSMAEDMRVWAQANANRGVGRKQDWGAAFKGWMRRSAPGGSAGGPAPTPPRNNGGGGAGGSVWASMHRELRDDGEVLL